VIVDCLLLLLMVICALVVVQMKDLLSALMLLSIYSLIMALVWVRMDAPDVALTEAAVGAGITTVLFIAALSKTKRGEKSIKEGSFGVVKLLRYSSGVALIVILIVGTLLAIGTLDMPDYGDIESPANTHLAAEYVKNAYKETGSKNIVTAILVCYRGFDTFGEVVVIFTAGIGTVLLLRKATSKDQKEREKDFERSIICTYHGDEIRAKMPGGIVRKVIARLSIAFIMLYGLYVIAHGKVSPGGGFQGGVIIAASVLLFIIAFGMREGLKRFEQWKTDIMCALGVLVILVVSSLPLFFGGKFMEFVVVPIAEPIWSSKIAITVIEFGIGLTVAAVMVTLFVETAKKD